LAHLLDPDVFRSCAYVVIAGGSPMNETTGRLLHAHDLEWPQPPRCLAADPGEGMSLPRHPNAWGRLPNPKGEGDTCHERSFIAAQSLQQPDARNNSKQLRIRQERPSAQPMSVEAPRRMLASATPKQEPQSSALQTFALQLRRHGCPARLLHGRLFQANETGGGPHG
jgi:hypothetical protein